MISPKSIDHRNERSVLAWGFIVSFLGSLPPGTTNVLMVQLAATKGHEVATWFATGCMISEVLCVGLCTMIMDRISRSPKIMRAFEWVSLLVIAWIVVSSFATLKGSATTTLQIVPGNFSPFLFGLILMAANPVQLPFWAGWTTVLMQRGLLKPDRSSNIEYIFGIAVGSIVASLLFIAFGKMITGWMAGKEQLIQWIFTAIFVAIAAIQVRKIIIRPKAY